ncbi:unnamed protein product [Ixodes persulcatus]
MVQKRQGTRSERDKLRALHMHASCISQPKKKKTMDD